MKLDFGIKGLIVKDGKFLALHKLSSTDSRCELPGGRMEYGETIEDTLKREIYEETKLNVEPVYLIVTWNYINKENKHQVAGVIYFCKVPGYINDVNLSEEHDSYCWLTPEELVRMNDSFAPRMKKWDWNKLLNV